MEKKMPMIMGVNAYHNNNYRTFITSNDDHVCVKTYDTNDVAVVIIIHVYNNIIKISIR
jgi:hypothetical protein